MGNSKGKSKTKIDLENIDKYRKDLERQKDKIMKISK